MSKRDSYQGIYKDRGQEILTDYEDFQSWCASHVGLWQSYATI